MKYLAVKDFAKFQHYRDRNPPWIKLYGTLLSDAAFLQMPEAAQAQLIKLWILASQLGHPLPNNPKLLAGRIGALGRFYLTTLIDAGFIIPTEQNASVLIDSGYPDAQPLEERGELEKELSISPAVAVGESLLANKLACDADRIALAAIIARSSNRAACLASLDAMLTGNDPAVVCPSVALFGQALRDYAGNVDRWNAAHFRGYLKRVGMRQATGPALVQTSAASSSNGNTAGRAALVFGQIRALVQETQAPGQALRRFIPKAKVAALGADVLAAYEAVGGSDAVVNATPERIGFLIRDFTQALEAAHAAA